MGCTSSKESAVVMKAEQSVNVVHERDAASTGSTASTPKKMVDLGEYNVAITDGPSTPKPGPITRAYSSGGSSDASSDSHRHRRTSTIEVFDLSAVKDSVHADGYLNGKVVRMETPFGKPIEEIYDGVHTGKVLGSGVSGIVREVSHKATGVKYAVKCLDLGLITSAEGLAQLREEIYIMCQLDHPNIVRLEEVYESMSEIYLVLELCIGGDLFDRLDEQTDFHYTEAQCAILVKQMLSSVRYLHSKKIVHRDLKLENFLFSSRDTDSVLKMIDFGLSKHFTFIGEAHSEAVGTPYTVAPEVIKGSYNEKCDIWAVGVIAYLLLSGETPFGGVDGEALCTVRENILKGTITFEPADVWDNVSDLAKDFVKTCLQQDAEARPSAKECQRHRWIHTYSKKISSEGTKLKANVVEALVAFKEYSDMRKLLCEVLSFTLLPEQIKDLRDEFEKIDTGDGEISLRDLKQVLMVSAEARALGGMTEEEVEDLFNALRVRKSETKIRWHEFIAAGLSQCKVDERNLKLAFDRIDGERKGYITFDDVIDLVGESDACENKEELKMMWMESIRHINGDLDRITVDDFLLVMKGQAFGQGETARLDRKRTPTTRMLDAITEGKISPQVHRTIADFKRFEGGADLNLHSLPELADVTEGGLSLEPLQSQGEAGVPRREYFRLRSRSMEHNKTHFFDGEEDSDDDMRPNSPGFGVLLPARSKRQIDTVLEDQTMTPLMANKAIYRAHRGMRLAVIEASKRFEEKRQRRILHQKLEEEGKLDQMNQGISLVMRRGTMGEPMKPDIVEEDRFDEEHIKSEQQARERASMRSGRPRRNKTVSDITGMGF